jgi:predicted MFS family arabinose efflux permease
MTAYGAVATTFAVAGVSFGTWASRIPTFKNELDLEPAQLGSILLVLALASIVSFPIAGRVMDLYGSARVSKCLTLFTLASLILVSFASSSWFLTFSVAIFGASIGSLDVAMNGWGAEVERSSVKPIMSSLHAYWSLFAGIGGLAGLLAIEFGFSIEQHILLVVLIMSGLAVLTFRVSWMGSIVNNSTPAFAWPRKSLWFVGFLMFCAALTEGAVADWAAILLQQRLKLTEATAVSGFVIFSLAMCIGRMLADNLVHQIGAIRVCFFGGLLATLGICVILFGSSLSIVLVGFLLLGFGLAPVFPLGCSRAANDPFVTPGQGLSGVATLGYGGIMFGPAIIGFVAQYSEIFVGFSLLLLCTLYQAVFSSCLRR